MPRISGVDIPAEKRIEYSLRYIHGLGPKLVNDVLAEAKIELGRKAKDLTEEEVDDTAAFFDVTVDLTAVLGTSYMHISQVLKLGRGAVVELDRRVGEDIEMVANGRPVARGEITVLDDQLAVTITSIIKRTG